LRQGHHQQQSPQAAGSHINVLELATILLAALAFAPQMRDTTHLVVRSDNTVALAAIRRRHSTSPTIAWLALLSTVIFEVLAIKAVSPTHLPGLLNPRADTLSRAWTPTRERIECPLSTSVLQFLQQKLRVQLHDGWIDAFASFSHHQLPSYWALGPDPAAAACDAFAQRWQDKLLFINPPFILAGVVVRRLLRDRPRIALVVLPDHRGQSWHAALDEIATRSCRLSPRRSLLNPPKHAIWMLRAWLIYAD
tara:strand:+ start:123 stop:875 length:753 start_codon:yes stop_codon:yes gene_type:complete